MKARNRDSTTEMHKQLGLLDLDSRRKMHLSFTCHKIVASNGTSSLSKYFIPLNVGGRRVTRRSNGRNMRVPKMRTMKGRCSISFRGPNHWNSLSNELKVLDKYESFKKGYSRELISNFENHPT